MRDPLQKMNTQQLRSQCQSAAAELATRVEEAEDTTAEVQSSYDQLAKNAEAWQTQAKVLKEVCEAAASGLRTLLADGMCFDVAALRVAYEGLAAGLEQVRSLEE